MNVHTKKVMKYVLLPQVAPRLQTLFGGGFSFMASLIAQIFASVRLLPANHPYLQSRNSGRFNIRHTIFEAWRHLRFDWQHSDQVVIFFVIVLGLFILTVQVALLFIGMFSMTSAMALSLPAYFDDMFITPDPENDIAFILMDRVFGIPDLFGSCVSTGAACFGGTQYNPAGIIVDPVFPTPFHDAFHEFLSVYSYGLLVIAAMVIVYYVISVIGETAQSGTPFGKRFNRVWAPLRLVIALGLLIPLESGLNSAQYIVLYAAKFGSGFATNGWNMFLDGAGLPGGTTILGDSDTLVGMPSAPPINSLLEFGSSLGACIRTQRFYHNREIQGFIVNPMGMTPAAARINLDTDPTYQDALEFSNYGDIYFVFGEYKEEAGRPTHISYPGAVKPFCGEVVLQITDVADAYSPGSTTILDYYFSLIEEVLWADAVNTDPPNLTFAQIGENAMRRYAVGYPGYDPALVIAEQGDLQDFSINYEAYVEVGIEEGIEDQRAADNFNELDNYGWAGAGLWYNKIAEMNGMVIGATNSLPVVRKFPMVMEEVLKERMKYDQDASGPERFMPRRADGTEIQLKNSKYNEADILYNAFKVWGDKISRAKPTGNIFTDTIHAIFGTRGLYNMAANTDIHPLAQLVGVGKTLVESAIRNLGASATAGIFGGLTGILGMHQLGSLASHISSFAGMIALAAMTAGFLLFYLVPFLPFLYYFFALGVWVKTVLEAMVGVPLWALAHLRIDGDGLPGQSAMAGYFLVFEVFLRPICVVFGLLASIAIFGAQVKLLHEIWSLVVSNLTGFDAASKTLPAPEVTGGITWFRSVIDQFFFTLIYVFIVYMMALASFKLIDLVPDYIMRWMGSSVSTFGDIYKDDVAGMPTRAVMGVGAGLQQGMQAGGQLANAAKAATAKPKGG